MDAEPGIGLTSAGAVQDVAGLPSCKGTVLALAQPIIHQHPQVLFCPLCCLSARFHGVILFQVQDFALIHANLHEFLVGPLFHLFKVPLNDNPALQS